jgi:hypothetical protein
MRLSSSGLVGTVLASGLLLSGCAEAAESVTSHAAEHATVEHVEGSDLSRLTLSASAIARLDIQTAVVRQSGRGKSVIPYAAVIYAADGATWAYSIAEPTAFVRHPITVDRIEGTDAVLSQGPPVGSRVVTVGAAELLGTELDVGH